MSAQPVIVRPLRDSTIPAHLSPKDLLFPKQRAFVDDHSQYKIAVTTRQWGKSTVTSGEAVHDCLTDPGTKWVCMSAGERQSVEWLNKAKEWLAAYQLGIEDIAEDRSGLAEGLLRSTEISLANGSKIIAIPANPSTARGYSANVILDEFAWQENPGGIWSAMFPSTTNKLAGSFLERWRAMLRGDEPPSQRALKLRVVSTFNGKNNKFYDLWEKGEENGYSKHKVTIYDAVADGMPLDIEKLRKALDDPEAWAEEFECEAGEESAVLLPWDLIATCEDGTATHTIDPEFWHGPKPSGPLTMGFDFARKKHFSIAWTTELMGDVQHTREILEMEKMSTPDQFRMVEHRIERVERVSFDYTGPGIGLGDLLVERFGEFNPAKDRNGKIELVNFSQTTKVDLFSKLKVAFESKKLRIPIHRVTRDDLHSVHRVVSANGGITYRAAQTEDGHADRCTALALCVRAGAANAAHYEAILC